ncbi:hypothetical protein [Saccharopolyspora endophytica]|uniref:Roadblock/LAMTOR2 domain-containing protein n=1 Tax=Saccharopolyspora endophytica TaxID=543886 RepID=A0ABS5DQX7_9PSEU|nr:hypothetical protein [Saccharopolyspora endophytica]MBQ0928605.1 hypothetical protein [Saccharopolyspora endophytica]
MTSANDRDLTYLLDDLRATTLGVCSIVHASTDGICRHFSGLTREAAEREAALASSMRASAMQVPTESIIDEPVTDLTYLNFEVVGSKAGLHAMLTQPADRGLLLAVADDRCPPLVLAKTLKQLGNRVASWWKTDPLNGTTSLAR